MQSFFWKQSSRFFFCLLKDVVKNRILSVVYFKRTKEISRKISKNTFTRREELTEILVKQKMILKKLEIQSLEEKERWTKRAFRKTKKILEFCLLLFLLIAIFFFSRRFYRFFLRFYKMFYYTSFSSRFKHSFGAFFYPSRIFFAFLKLLFVFLHLAVFKTV